MTTTTSRTQLPTDHPQYTRFVEICAGLTAHRKALKSAPKKESKDIRRAMHVLWMEREAILVAAGRTSPYAKKDGALPALRAAGATTGRKAKSAGMVRKPDAAPPVDRAAGPALATFKNGQWFLPDGTLAPDQANPVAQAPAAVQAAPTPQVVTVAVGDALVTVQAATPAPVGEVIPPAPAAVVGATATEAVAPAVKGLSAVILKAIALTGACTPTSLAANINDGAPEPHVTAKQVADALRRLEGQGKVRKAGAGRYAPLSA